MNTRALKTLLAVIITAATTACGTREETQPATEPALVDARLQPVIDAFLDDCQRFDKAELCDARMLAMTEVTAKAQMPTVGGITPRGICYFQGSSLDGSFSPIGVWVSEELLESPDELKAVMYHELGHCLLGKGHSLSAPRGSATDDPIMMANPMVVIGMAGHDDMDAYKIPQLFLAPATPLVNQNK